MWKIGEETSKTDAEPWFAPSDTSYDKESGETLRQSVFQDIVQTMNAQFDSVPKIYLWI